MANDRERNQGMKRGIGERSGQQAPARNPQDDRSAGQRGIQHGNMPGQNQQSGRRGNDFDPSRGGDGGSYKQGGQNEQNTRR